MSRPLLLVSLVSVVGQYSFWATTYTFVPLYADRLGADKTAIGLLTSVVLVPAAFAPALLGPLSSRWGPTPVVMVGYLLVAMGTFVTPRCPNVWLVGLIQTISGTGRGLSQPLLMSMAIEDVPTARRATTMGVFQAIYAFGIFLGPVTAGKVADTVGLSGAFVVSGAMCLLAAGIEGLALRTAAYSSRVRPSV